jgi:hypothetical protein
MILLRVIVGLSGRLLCLWNVGIHLQNCMAPQSEHCINVCIFPPFIMNHIYSNTCVNHNLYPKWLFLCHKLIQWNLYRSRILRPISMIPERIQFQLCLLHLLFSRIHCVFFRPPTKTMNRGFTVFPFQTSIHNCADHIKSKRPCT